MYIITQQMSIVSSIKPCHVVPPFRKIKRWYIQTIGAEPSLHYQKEKQNHHSSTTYKHSIITPLPYHTNPFRSAPPMRTITTCICMACAAKAVQSKRAKMRMTLKFKIPTLHTATLAGRHPAALQTLPSEITEGGSPS